MEKAGLSLNSQHCGLRLDRGCVLWVPCMHSTTPSPPPSFISHHWKERSKGIPSLLAWDQGPAGMGVGWCKSDSLCFLAGSPTDYCLCCWKLGGAGKQEKAGVLCVQVSVEANSRPSDLHWDIPVSLLQEQ